MENYIFNLGIFGSGSLPERSYDRDEASSVTLTNFDDKKDGREKMPGSVHCSKSWDKRPGFVSNFNEFAAVEVEPVALNKVNDRSMLW